jgi:hypothetical protein
MSRKAGLDDVEKRNFMNLPGLELRPLGRPARRQSLYRVRYPCFYWLHLIMIIVTILGDQTGFGLDDWIC